MRFDEKQSVPKTEMTLCLRAVPILTSVTVVSFGYLFNTFIHGHTQSNTGVLTQTGIFKHL